MTAADTADTSVRVLIDAAEDGVVESHAWVKVTSLTATPEDAIARLQREFPVEEQGEGGEGMRYICQGVVKHMRPLALPDETGHVNWEGTTYAWSEVPWRETDADDPVGDEFWVIEVTDDAA